MLGQIKGLEQERDELKEAQKRQYEVIKEEEKEWCKVVMEKIRLAEEMQQLKTKAAPNWRWQRMAYRHDWR